MGSPSALGNTSPPGAIVARTVNNTTTADLGTVAVGARLGAVEGGGTVGSDPLLEPIATPDDADYVYVSNHPGGGWTADWTTPFAVADMPADFASMNTLTIRLRYARQAGTQVNGWTLRAVVRKADGTDLTDHTTVASNITTTTPTNSAVVTFTGLDTTATKADWDGAKLYIRWIITGVGGGDTLQRRVYAAELSGTYTAATGTQRYSNGVTLDQNNNVTEHVIGLPGGATVTRRADQTQVWSYPNLHGDIVATTDSSGTKQGATVTYDPYGNPLTGLPDNRADDLDHAWLGQNQMPTEHEAGLLAVIEMGARPYNPALGRFLQDDPVDGGSANSQDYVYADPVNGLDLDGTVGWHCMSEWSKKKCKHMTKKLHREADGDDGGCTFFGIGCNDLGDLVGDAGGWANKHLGVEVEAVLIVGFSADYNNGHFALNFEIGPKASISAGGAYFPEPLEGPPPYDATRKDFGPTGLACSAGPVSASWKTPRVGLPDSVVAGKGNGGGCAFTQTWLQL